MKNSRILLVEDNPDHQELTLMTLAENNVLNEIVVANDGIEVSVVHVPTIKPLDCETLAPSTSLFHQSNQIIIGIAQEG